MRVCVLFRLQIESPIRSEKDFTSASMSLNEMTRLWIFVKKNLFSKSWASKWGVRLICECGLYAGVYGISTQKWVFTKILLHWKPISDLTDKMALLPFWDQFSLYLFYPDCLELECLCPRAMPLGGKLLAGSAKFKPDRSWRRHQTKDSPLPSSLGVGHGSNYPAL